MDEPSNTHDAAVIVLHEKETDSLILTERSCHLRDHPGEICFPGGRWEEGDNTLYDTALRELQEELGIDSVRVQLQKLLKTEQTLSGYLIHPWLAFIDTISPYQINPLEVTNILRLPMSEVYKRANYQQIRVQRQGLEIVTYQFLAEHHVVWGATARIMMQLSR
jgi:8-oxo-dGTP pyrophosphatase MutT (NUDIX family)